MGEQPGIARAGACPRPGCSTHRREGGREKAPTPAFSQQPPYSRSFRRPGIYRSARHRDGAHWRSCGICHSRQTAVRIRSRGKNASAPVHRPGGFPIVPCRPRPSFPLWRTRAGGRPVNSVPTAVRQAAPAAPGRERGRKRLSKTVIHVLSFPKPLRRESDKKTGLIRVS